MNSDAKDTINLGKPVDLGSIVLPSSLDEKRIANVTEVEMKSQEEEKQKLAVVPRKSRFTVKTVSKEVLYISYFTSI